MSDFDDLSPKTKVPFAEVFLDPNNPRIAPDPAPGYTDPDLIFDPAVQAELSRLVYQVYKAEDLEAAIIAQGWKPVDPIIVWKHPEHKSGYIGVEGNTRLSVLRNIRNKLPAAREKLASMEESKRFKPDELEDQRRLVQHMERAVAATEELEVQCVKAKTVADLDDKLPELLGVRHILGTRDWKPYATNRYVLGLYERTFAAKFGADETLRIERDLVAKVADRVSMKPLEAKRAIQAAYAFGHFRRRFEDEVAYRRGPKDENGWKAEDQYYFVNILLNKYPRAQFGFEENDLRLTDEMEDALFMWAFAEYPPQGEHVFKIAEDIRAWQVLSAYDVKAKTPFASQIDVTKPAEAPTIQDLKYLRDQHKRQVTPVNTLKSLLEALTELPAEKLHAQAASLGPMLAQIAKQAQHFLDMIGNAQEARRGEQDA